MEGIDHGRLLFRSSISPNVQPNPGAAAGAKANKTKLDPPKGQEPKRVKQAEGEAEGGDATAGDDSHVVSALQCPFCALLCADLSILCCQPMGTDESHNEAVPLDRSDAKVRCCDLLRPLALSLHASFGSTSAQWRWGTCV